MANIAYKRVMLKISGEALSGANGFGFDFEVVGRIAREVKTLVDMGVEVGLVVGGGNIWRGRTGEGMDRTTADHMGMLATCINALALQDAFSVLQSVQTAHGFHQTAGIDNIHQILRKRGNRKFLTV